MNVPTPICLSLKKALQKRARELADDCEERARRSMVNGEARALYHLVAREARRLSVAPHLGEGDCREALAALTALARVARWYDGEGFADPLPAYQPAPALPLPEPPRPIAGELLNAAQLAAMFGMGERGARKAIERGYSRGLAGFHRHGALWFAEREAFAKFRAR
jgi:hypothetical protein